MSPLHVVVFGSEDTAPDKVHEQLLVRNGTIRHAADPTELAGALDSPCDLLVVYLPDPPERALRAVRVVHDALPALPIVLVSDEAVERHLRERMTPSQLVSCGASALIADHADIGTISATFDRAAALAARSRAWATSLMNGTGPTTGQFHLVTSTGGGTGRTFVATSIAALLSTSGQSTCIIDLDGPFGDVALALQTPTRFTVADAIGPEVDEVVEHLPRLCEKVRPGLFMLSAAAHDVPIPTGREARGLVAAARRLYDHVVVDAPPTPSPITHALLDDATEVWCVQTPDLGSIRAMKLLLENLASAGIDADRTRIVLNKYTEGLGVDLDDVAGVLAREPALVVPHDRAIAHSLNDGHPLVLKDQRGIAESLRQGLSALLDPPRPDALVEDPVEQHSLRSWVPAGWVAGGAAAGAFAMATTRGLGWI